MKYIAVLDTDDFKDFEFFEDGNGKYLHAVDAGAVKGEWIYLPFKPLEQQPCEDCVSRQTLDKIKELMTDINGDTVYAVRMSDLRQLPSAKPATQWHKIKTRPLTEEEKDEMCLNDNYYTFMYDCEMPDDEQEVLIKTKWGIEKTTYHTDDGCYFEDYEDEDDVIAWTELPKWEE